MSQAQSEARKDIKMKTVRRPMKVNLPDLFSKPYPLFNDKGKYEVSSKCGIGCTFLLLFFFIPYFSYKWAAVIQRSDSNVQQVDVADFWTVDENYVIEWPIAIAVVSDTAKGTSAL